MTIISHTAGENIEGAFSILLLLNLRPCSFEDEEKLVWTIFTCCILKAFEAALVMCDLSVLLTELKG